MLPLSILIVMITNSKISKSLMKGNVKGGCKVIETYELYFTVSIEK